MPDARRLPDGTSGTSTCSRSTTRPCPRGPSGCASPPRRCIRTPTSTIWWTRCSVSGGNAPCRTPSRDQRVWIPRPAGKRLYLRSRLDAATNGDPRIQEGEYLSNETARLDRPRCSGGRACARRRTATPPRARNSSTASARPATSSPTTRARCWPGATPRPARTSTASSAASPGTWDDFSYGDSMVAYGETGAVWEQENFVAYVQDPTGFLREALDDRRARGKMAYQVRDEQQAHDLYAFLATFAARARAAEPACRQPQDAVRAGGRHQRPVAVSGVDQRQDQRRRSGPALPRAPDGRARPPGDTARRASAPRPRAEVRGGTARSPLSAISSTGRASCGSRPTRPPTSHCAIIASVASTCPRSRDEPQVEPHHLGVGARAGAAQQLAHAGLGHRRGEDVGGEGRGRQHLGHHREQPARDPLEGPEGGVDPDDPGSRWQRADLGQPQARSPPPAEWPTTASGAQPSGRHSAASPRPSAPARSAPRAPSWVKPWPGRSTATTRYVRRQRRDQPAPALRRAARAVDQQHQRTAADLLHVPAVRPAEHHARAARRSASRRRPRASASAQSGSARRTAADSRLGPGAGQRQVAPAQRPRPARRSAGVGPGAGVDHHRVESAGGRERGPAVLASSAACARPGVPSSAMLAAPVGQQRQRGVRPAPPRRPRRPRARPSGPRRAACRRRRAAPRAAAWSAPGCGSAAAAARRPSPRKAIERHVVAPRIGLRQQQLDRALGLAEPGQRGRARGIDGEDHQPVRALLVAFDASRMPDVRQGGGAPLGRGRAPESIGHAQGRPQPLPRRGGAQRGHEVEPRLGRRAGPGARAGAGRGGCPCGARRRRCRRPAARPAASRSSRPAGRARPDRRQQQLFGQIVRRDRSAGSSRSAPPVGRRAARLGLGAPAGAWRGGRGSAPRPRRDRPSAGVGPAGQGRQPARRAQREERRRGPIDAEIGGEPGDALGRAVGQAHPGQQRPGGGHVRRGERSSARQPVEVDGKGQPLGQRRGQRSSGVAPSSRAISAWLPASSSPDSRPASPAGVTLGHRQHQSRRGRSSNPRAAPSRPAASVAARSSPPRAPPPASRDGAAPPAARAARRAAPRAPDPRARAARARPGPGRGDERQRRPARAKASPSGQVRGRSRRPDAAV